MLERIRNAVGGDRRRWRPATEVGLALGPDELVAVTVRRGLRGPSPDRVFRRPLDAGPAEGEWPALATALRGLRGRLDAGEGARLRAHVALLPPLGRAKVVRLPAARRDALRRLAHRESDRHFLPPPGSRWPTASRWRGGATGPSPPW